MFQNAYQGGTHVEIYDAKVNKDKEKSYANLYRMTTPQGFSKIFDKDIKGYVFSIDGHSTKMRFPKDDRVDLCIVQHFLVLQIYLPYGSPWNLEIGIADTSKVNRRINLVSALNKIETKYFHVKVPNDIVKRGVWMNLSIDVNSFMEAWKGQTFRSIDNIYIGSACKLRRVYSMKNPILEFNEDDDESAFQGQTYQQQYQQQNSLYQTEDAPKNYAFPPGFPYINQLINYQRIMDNVDPKYLESSVDHAEATKTIGGATGLKTIGGKNTAAGTLQKNTVGKTIKQNNTNNGMLIAGGNHTNSNNMKSYQNRQAQQQQQQQQQLQQQQYQMQGEVGITQDFQEDIVNVRSSYNPKQEQSGQQRILKKEMVLSGNNIDEGVKADGIDQLSRQRKEGSIAGRGQALKQQQQKQTQVAQQQKRIVQYSRSPNGQVQEQQIGRAADHTPKSKQAANGKNAATNPWYASKASKKLFEREDEEEEDQFQREDQNEEENEEIEENLEAEYYDQYEINEELPASTRKQSNRQVESKQVSNSNNNNNNGKGIKEQRQMDSSVKPKESSVQLAAVPADSKRNVKSANVFGTKKTPSLAETKAKKDQKLKQAAGSGATGGGAGQNKILSQQQQSNGNQNGVAAASACGSDLDEDSYFQLTQKFNTISDPNQFRDVFAATLTNQANNNSNNKEKDKEPKDNNIEEDIEVDIQASSPNGKGNSKKATNQLREQETANSQKNQQQQAQNRKNNLQSQAQPSPLQQNQSQHEKKKQPQQQSDSYDRNNRDLEDSLERPYGQQNKEQEEDEDESNFKANNSNTNKKDGQKQLGNNNGSSSKRSETSNSNSHQQTYNVYENHLNKFINDSSRPFTPPFQVIVPLQSSSIVTKKNNETVVIKNNQRQQPEGKGGKNEYADGDDFENEEYKEEQNGNDNRQREDVDQLEVIYDPVLQCYYDPNTKSYYELKQN